MYKCVNCSYIGTELSKRNEFFLEGKCPVCGDEVEEIEETNDSKIVNEEINDSKTIKASKKKSTEKDLEKKQEKSKLVD